MSTSGDEVKILGLGGSLRVPSTSLASLKIALAAAEEAGATVELLDLNHFMLPPFRPEQPVEAYPDPDFITAYLAKFGQMDGFIWSAPTYHSTPSAAFKNALDFLELLPRRPRLYLTGKVVGLIAIAGNENYGANSLTALIHNARALRLIIATGSLHVSPTKRIFDPEGQLQDDKMAARLGELGREVARLARLFKQVP